MTGAASATKKRKAAGGPAPATSKKLSASVGSLLARLEATNAAFLQTAATKAVQTQLAKVKAASSFDAPLASKSSSSPSLASLPLDKQELERRLDRKQRFQEERAAAAAAAGIKEAQKTLVEVRSQHGVARGQNQNLEKEYLRLTSLPSITDVRPPEVLRDALELVKRRWTEGCEYKYACDQLKSIRQDLTVQHVRNKFTVQVYETHGRIAIEVGDFAEYRSCHSVLQPLYAEGIQGEQWEFAAYGLLYAAASGREVLCHELVEVFSGKGYHSSSGSGSGSGSKIPSCSAEIAGDRFLGHALAVCRAFGGGDFVRFMQLYLEAPRMAPYLMDLLLPKMRIKAYNTVLAAFLPSVPLAALAGWFGFTKRKEAAAFLKERGAVVVDGCLDIKASRAAQQRQQGFQQTQQ